MANHQEEPNNTSRLFRGASAIALVLLAIFALLAIVGGVRHRDQAKLNILVEPLDSQIQIDGAPAKAGTAYVAPGQHRVTASRQNFISDTETVTASKKGPNNVYLAPTPTGSEGQRWVDNHPGDEQKRVQYAQINQNKVQDTLNNSYPLVKALPADTVYFTISYGPSQKFPNDPTKIAIYITAAPGNRQQALHWIKYKGYNPSDYEIIYKDVSSD